MYIGWGVISSGFWAVILSFIPTTLYLLFINPQIYAFRSARAVGIYVLNEEAKQARREKDQVRVVALIFLVCFLLVGAGFFLKWNVQFDILSTATIVFFALAILFYIPVIIYIILRKPWRYHERGICLNGIYVGYGISLLIFSGIFAYHWMNVHGLTLSFSNAMSTVFFIFVSSAALSYLPILVYIFMSELKHRRLRRAHHPNILFIIYALCFLVCTGVYFYDLSLMHRAIVNRDNKI